ncbi:M24 family metallopeptidase [Oceanidesulfovibrio marinus]|uniref:Aminopeptidase P family protein n=1 Tax=Oceanidesulfovibrio marinus TaxID=370038 RepID=A0ABX6NJI9_9BACT|nr:aminopeptidase P family protein [Oceanidesulfovibrio marinus]
MMQARLRARRARLRQRISEAGLAGLLVSHAANRYYLTGFELHDAQCNESSGLLLITAAGEDYLLTDPRYKDAALRLWPEENLFIYTGGAREAIREFLEKTVDTSSGPLGFESKAMCMDDYGFFSETVKLQPADGHVEEMRLIKDPVEIEAMRRSCGLNHAVFSKVPELLIPGTTEAELAWELEKLFREHGASELSFNTIAAVGPNAALPHAVPGEDQVLDNCPVLVDMGCRLDNYCSDQTRTFWAGDKPTDEFKRTLELVQEAQALAIEMIKPGVPMIDAYNTARDYFEKNGVAEYFTHGLGHGVGLETHEAPSISTRSKGEFKSGMVVTVEPGLYYPEWGGVRWEYMVLVTDNGCEVL